MSTSLIYKVAFVPISINLTVDNRRDAAVLAGLLSNPTIHAFIRDNYNNGYLTESYIDLLSQEIIQAMDLKDDDKSTKDMIAKAQDTDFR